MSSLNRKISNYSVFLGSVLCMLGAIWYPQDAAKWIGSCIYLQLVSRCFGLTYSKERVVGMEINKTDLKHITDFRGMKKS